MRPSCLLFASASLLLLAAPSVIARPTVAQTRASAATPAAAPYSLTVTHYPAKLAKATSPSITVALKNLSKTPLTFAEIASNKLAFELWEYLGGNDATWAEVGQGYSYFRSLPAIRELEASNFGVIKPGATGVVTLTLHWVAVIQEAPVKPWVVLGRDKGGWFYAERKGPPDLHFVASTDVFVVTLGTVTHLRSNPDGHMIADVVNLSDSNHFKMNTKALAL